MYTLSDFGLMIGDRERTAAYARALEQRVTPSSVVLDVGAGSGILSLLACRAGARKVYAVEPNDAIQVARDAAAASGFGERIEFIQATAADIELPERVDIIVSDLHGVTPMFGNGLVALLDARARFLKPGGCLIPSRDTVWASLVSSAAAYDRVVGPWNKEYGFDFASARDATLNDWHKQWLRADELAVPPQPWAVIDYGTFESPNAGGEVSWTIDEALDAYGVGIWFDSELAPGVTLSNAPRSKGGHVYGHAFMPWPAPVSLSPGDRVSVTLRADFAVDDYVWRCNTRVTGEPSRAQKALYRQSTWRATPLSADRLRRRAATFVPTLTGAARIDRRILELMDERLSLEQIAAAILAAFPDAFPDLASALARVGGLSDRYSR